MSRTHTADRSDAPEIANADMAAAWDGPEGDHWTENAERYEATSDRYGEALLDAVALSEGETVLDVGCGTGGSTRQAARLVGSGSATGLDLSRRMLAYARRAAAAEGLTNALFLHGDAQVYPFEDEIYDVAVSLFGSMFFDDPSAAFANIRRAIRPGGRLALLAWRDLPSNEWIGAIRGALAMGRQLPMPPSGAPGPFAFADPGHPREFLARSGFVEVAVEQVDESMRLGKNADDAFSFVSSFGITRGLTHDLDESSKATALASLRALLSQHETDDGVRFGASAWLITGRADERA